MRTARCISRHEGGCTPLLSTRPLSTHLLHPQTTYPTLPAQVHAGIHPPVHAPSVHAPLYPHPLSTPLVHTPPPSIHPLFVPPAQVHAGIHTSIALVHASIHPPFDRQTSVKTLPAGGN